MPRHIRTPCQLSQIRRAVDDEDMYQQWLKDGLNTAGWTAVREVEPRDTGHRADLICETEVAGETVTVGIETKHTGDRSSVGKAAAQIYDRYHSKRFAVFDEVDLWAVATAREYCHKLNEMCKRAINGLGLGWLEDRDGDVVITFAAKQPTLRLPLFDHGDDGECDTPVPEADRVARFDVDRCRRIARTEPF